MHFSRLAPLAVLACSQLVVSQGVGYSAAATSTAIGAAASSSAIPDNTLSPPNTTTSDSDGDSSDSAASTGSVGTVSGAASTATTEAIGPVSTAAGTPDPGAGTPDSTTSSGSFATTTEDISPVSTGSVLDSGAVTPDSVVGFSTSVGPPSAALSAAAIAAASVDASTPISTPFSGKPSMPHHHNGAHYEHGEDDHDEEHHPHHHPHFNGTFANFDKHKNRTGELIHFHPIEDKVDIVRVDKRLEIDGKAILLGPGPIVTSETPETNVPSAFLRKSVAEREAQPFEAYGKGHEKSVSPGEALELSHHVEREASPEPEPTWLGGGVGPVVIPDRPQRSGTEGEPIFWAGGHGPVVHEERDAKAIEDRHAGNHNDTEVVEHEAFNATGKAHPGHDHEHETPPPQERYRTPRAP